MSAPNRTRVGIISDTHSHLDPRIADVLRGCDIAVHAGDIMGKHVLDAMRPAGGEIIAVRGNNDTRVQWQAEHHEALHALGFEARLDLPGGQAIVLHGHEHWTEQGLHDVLRERFPHVRLIIYGHSHKLVCDLDTFPWVINPGAAGRIRTHGGPSCLILDASEDDWQIDTIRFAEAGQIAI